MLVAFEHLGPLTGDTSPCDDDRFNHARQVMDERVIARDDPLERLLLPSQLRATDELPFQWRETLSEFRKRAGEHGDFLAFRVFTQLVPIERQKGFQPECIPRAKADGCRPLGYDQVPQHQAVLPVGEELKTQRFARVAGAGHFHLSA